jgi:hypothetical protein
MRFYFHVKDGSTILDDEGSEFPSVEAVKNNAIRASGEMLRGLDHDLNFWSGEPWKLWVTDGTQRYRQNNLGTAIYGQASLN